MNINVERIEFVVTNRCNSHCKHCFVDTAARSAKPAAIGIETATRVIKEVTGKYSPQSIMTFGGEPLLFPEVVYAIHKTAKECGIGKREIITNAGWARSLEESQVVAAKLAESGVTQMSISVDGFHQEYVPLQSVERNVRSLLDAGIAVKWNPCWVVSKQHRNPWNMRTESVLNCLKHLPVPEDEGNSVQPTGNALKYLSEYLPEKAVSPQGGCENQPYASRLDHLTGISVEPNGDITVCKEFHIGNTGKLNVVEILQNYDPHKIPEMEAILQGGMAKLEEYANQRGVTGETGGYYSICGKCVDLRRKLRKQSGGVPEK